MVLPFKSALDISSGEEPYSYPSIFLQSLSPDLTALGYFSKRISKSFLLEQGTIRFAPLLNALTYVVEALIVSTIMIESERKTAAFAPSIPCSILTFITITHALAFSNACQQ